MVFDQRTFGRWTFSHTVNTDAVIWSTIIFFNRMPVDHVCVDLMSVEKIPGDKCMVIKSVNQMSVNHISV
jgi:hypothetical protein